MSQTTQANPGFVLPAPGSSPAQTSTATVATPGAEPAPNLQITIADTSSRDLLIGGAILLVLFVAFFFAKNAYANTLVGKRVSPTKANAAGWWLFVFLASLATGVVLSAINATMFLKPLILGPIAAIGILALVLMLLSGRK